MCEVLLGFLFVAASMWLLRDQLTRSEGSMVHLVVGSLDMVRCSLISRFSLNLRAHPKDYREFSHMVHGRLSLVSLRCHMWAYGPDRNSYLTVTNYGNLESLDVSHPRGWPMNTSGFLDGLVGVLVQVRILYISYKLHHSPGPEVLLCSSNLHADRQMVHYADLVDRFVAGINDNPRDHDNITIFEF